MIRASIDIGSNSVLLLCAEFSIENHSITKELLNISHITTLGKDLDKTKNFCQDSMDATYRALSDFKEKLSKFNFKAEDALVTATEASRVATNAKEFFLKIKNDLGFSITTITGDGEAHYTAVGVVSKISENNLVVMDIGGASTEFIKIVKAPFKISNSISLPVGAVRATDWIASEEYSKKIADLVKMDLHAYETKTLVCVAGSMTTLASMYLGQALYDDLKVDGLKISSQNFSSFVKDLQNTSLENIKLLFPSVGKRLPFVKAGALVASTFIEKLGVTEIQISTRGLRYGVLLSGAIDGSYISR